MRRIRGREDFDHPRRPRTGRMPRALAVAALLFVGATWSGHDASAKPEPPIAGRTVVAYVVALDQPFWLNRLGAAQLNGMIFALQRDVVHIDTKMDFNGNDVLDDNSCKLEPGQVRLRSGKRPRPIVLRCNVGDTLEIHFWNLLSEDPKSEQPVPQTRYAGLHIQGLDLAGSIASDASDVGANGSSYAKPGGKVVYSYTATAEGTFLLYSAAEDQNPPGGLTGTLNAGLFGACNVQPRGAEWYRSQVTKNDLHWAAHEVVNEKVPSAPGLRWRPGAKPDALGEITSFDRKMKTIRARFLARVQQGRLYTDTGHPVINWAATYPEGTAPGCERADQKLPLPILQMWRDLPDGKIELVHTDLTAIITGPNAGRFPYYLESPSFNVNPAMPDRRQPYREFTIIYHDLNGNHQAFPIFDDTEDPTIAPFLSPGRDAFPINYGTGGIGAEILANRLGVGPEGNADAVELKYEEFFLSSWSVGDPAMVADTYKSLVSKDKRKRERVLVAAVPLGKMVAPPPTAPAKERKDPVPAWREAFARARIPLTPTARLETMVPGKEWIVRNHGQEFSTFNAPRELSFLVEKVDDDLRISRLGAAKALTRAARGVAPLTRLQPPKRVYYPDDPSNVYHSYLRDHCKFRILNAGPSQNHVHHLHAHQWLHTPNSDESHYLDSQMLMPGATYTLEMVYNGSGNRNQTVGDSIFHCHFYPHFAQGMWSLWRVHDVFEIGTTLTPQGLPAPGWNRALPDGELPQGTPIPAVVPLPTLGMAPMPALVRLNGKNEVKVPTGDGKGTEWLAPGRKVHDTKPIKRKLPDGSTSLMENPGFPFFVPGIAGHRAPHPPMDFAWLENDDRQPIDLDGNVLPEGAEKIRLDGGLPRHLVLNGKIFKEFHTRWDFTKDFVLLAEEGESTELAPNTMGDVQRAQCKEYGIVDGALIAMELPEQGTELEKIAMDFHARRSHATYQPDGQPGNFICNGLPPVPGAPYADPSVTDDGNQDQSTRLYKAAVIQTDVVFNKTGWHYPQQRFITLWGDVAPTVSGERAPQPFFFRSNTGDSIEFWHTNLVPNYYEMDDFQVRTPTDVIGQHIHLVKFDVTSSDGGGNGFNYEDGTFSPQEVRERICALNFTGGINKYNPAFNTWNDKKMLTVVPYEDHYKIFGEHVPPGQNWDGAQTTIQRWDADPLLNNEGHDRTLRTVFTHDHFGPSTHQQTGLYAGLLIEPEDSQWFTSAPSYDDKGAVRVPAGTPMYSRPDGGPTSWQAVIQTKRPEDSYREFALEFQDLQLAYTKDSTRVTRAPTPGSPIFVVSDDTSVSTEFAVYARTQRRIQEETESLTRGKPAEGVTAASVAKGQSTLASDVGKEAPNLPTNLQTVATQAQGWMKEAATLLQQNEVGAPTLRLQSRALRALTRINTTLQTNVVMALEESQRANTLAKALVALADAATPPPARAAALKVAQKEFGQAGIPLSKNATVAHFTDSVGPAPFLRTWTVYDPGPDNIAAAVPSRFEAQADYVAWDGRATTVSIFTPYMHPGWADPAHAVNPPTVDGVTRAPYPQLVSSGVLGTYSLNYRNEPLPIRIEPGASATAILARNQDPAYYFASIERQWKNLNRQPVGVEKDLDLPTPADFARKFPPPLNGVGTGRFDLGPFDPYTPMLQAYQNDKVQIRTLVGAHTLIHAFQLNGLKFRFEPSFADSGLRSVQGMGLSEHFEMNFDLPTSSREASFVDYLYQPSSGTVGQTNGLWGLLRAYRGDVDAARIHPLPCNPKGQGDTPLTPPDDLQPVKVRAVIARDVLPAGGLRANSRGKANLNNYPIVSPQALLYVREDDLGPDGKLKPGVDPEPLILRMRAGEWISVQLTNDLPKKPVPTKDTVANPVFPNTPAMAPFGTANIPGISLPTSRRVGLHAELLAYEQATDNGITVGANPDNTIGPGETRTYTWYAGDADGTPIEFGTVPLSACEPLVQHTKGLIGALIVEPAGSTTQTDPNTRASATVKKADGTTFREFVLLVQNDVQPGGLLDRNTGQLVPTAVDFQGAVSNRTEPVGYRYPNTPPAQGQAAGGALDGVPPGGPEGYANRFADRLVNGIPRTPRFEANAGDTCRFRIVFANGTAVTSQVFILHGHSWQEEPWQGGGTRIGDNKRSQVLGSQAIVPNQPLNLVIPSAGGVNKIPGHYYYGFFRNVPGAVWGVFHVK